MPEPIPLQPRRDTAAADATSLEWLGRLNPQPIPAAPPGRPPDTTPPPAPDPTDAQEAAALTAALTDAGMTATPEDNAAVQALVGLDPATVAAVTRWLRTKAPSGR